MFCVSLAFGCSDKQKGPKVGPGPDTPGDSRPEWVRMPPKGCAKGTAKMRGSEAAASGSAITRAKGQLAGWFKELVQKMVKDYLAAGEVEKKDFVEEEFKQAIRTVVNQTMVGSRLVREQIMGEQLYALVCLDAEAISSALEKMDRADDAMRKSLKQRADEEFKELDRQIEKIKQAK